MTKAYRPTMKMHLYLQISQSFRETSGILSKIVLILEYSQDFNHNKKGLNHSQKLRMIQNTYLNYILSNVFFVLLDLALVRMLIIFSCNHFVDWLKFAHQYLFQQFDHDTILKYNQKPYQ